MDIIKKAERKKKTGKREDHDSVKTNPARKYNIGNRNERSEGRASSEQIQRKAREKKQQ